MIAEEYLSWWCAIKLDDFGRVALERMESNWSEGRTQFDSLLKSGIERNKKFDLKINGENGLLLDPGAIWEDLALDAIAGFNKQSMRLESLTSLIVDISSVLLSMVSVQGFEEIEDLDIPMGKEEGALSRIESNKYERNRFNRALCLDFHGFRCQGCGDLLAERYGTRGSKVIHVHHIIPVARMGSPRALNPIEDLIPLCPNCHNIVHRTDPPLPVAELQLLTGYVDEAS
jgi:5-methylcytosine-specific restriction protein A